MNEEQGHSASSELRSGPDNPIADTARAATRPIVTVLFAGAFVGMAVEGADPPGWFLSLAIPVITWWFGERAYIHKKERERQ